jgi:predicted nucleotidyltransferase
MINGIGRAKMLGAKISFHPIPFPSDPGGEVYTMNETLLSSGQSDALREIRTRVMERFEVVEFLLYGSAARRDAEYESDLDLMIVVSKPISRFKRHEITDIVFDVNLQYGTNFSTLVVDLETWESGPFSVLPLRDEIIRDGVRL